MPHATQTKTINNTAHEPIAAKPSGPGGFSRQSGSSTLPGNSSVTAARPLMTVPNRKKKLRAVMPGGRLGGMAEIQPLKVFPLLSGLRCILLSFSPSSNYAPLSDLIRNAGSLVIDLSSAKTFVTGRMFDLLSANKKDSGLIFTFKDKPLHRIKTAWKAAIRRAKIRPCRFHDLRHSFNCRLLEAGVMQEVRKTLMGHSSGEDVHSTYVHIELPAKREAIRKLEVWLAAQNNLEQNQTQNKEEVVDDAGNLRAGDTDDSVERARRDSGSTA